VLLGITLLLIITPIAMVELGCTPVIMNMRT
jgi:hypothetical protein